MQFVPSQSPNSVGSESLPNYSTRAWISNYRGETLIETRIRDKEPVFTQVLVAKSMSSELPECAILPSQKLLSFDLNCSQEQSLGRFFAVCGLLRVAFCQVGLGATFACVACKDRINSLKFNIKILPQRWNLTTVEVWYVQARESDSDKAGIKLLVESLVKRI